MSEDQSLDLSNIISVSILAAAPGLGLQQINSIALFTKETKPGSWGSLAYKKYKNPTEVLTDWGSGSPVYAQAVALFAQQPNVLTTNGYLVVIPLLPTVPVAASLTMQDLVYTAKTPGVGGNSITIEYVAFGSSGGPKGAEVASVIGNAITVEIADGESIAAEIKEAIDNSVDASALVSCALVAGHETDTQDVDGPHALTNGLDASAEAWEAAIARTINTVYYFGILVDEVISEGELIALSAYVQGLDKILFYASRTAADFAASGMLDDLRTASKTHSRGLYYYDAVAGDTPAFAAGYAGRALSVDFAGINTVGSMHLKTLANFSPDQTIDQTALDAAKAAGVDVYAMFGNVARLFTSGANAYFDQIYCRLWFKNALQTAIFNYLAQTNTKIPQTEEGMDGLKAVINGVCQQAVRNGYLAPGAWTSDTVFGRPADLRRCIADVGYYMYSLPVAQQSQADREDRKAPVVQLALKESGAIHSASVIAYVNA